MTLFLALAACALTDSGPSGDTGKSGTCSELTSGDDWAWNGECPQMLTPVALTQSGCALTLDYSATGMTMEMPYSGTISGDTVTFADDDGVTGCTGSVVSADEVDGSCGSGCTFTLSR